MTQAEFISQFLSDENGKAAMSVATYSNLESKGGARLNEVIVAVSESLGLDSMIFSLEVEDFSNQIERLLPEKEEGSLIRKPENKKGDINQLLNRLTMYFAEQIFDKKLKKGDQIESDRVLAEKLGVGRSAIREALKVLDVLGMIDIRPGQGTFITNNETNFFIIPLSWSLFLNGDQVDSIITVRNVLEVKAAELAATYCTQESMVRLTDITHDIQEAYLQKDFDRFLDGDLAFHTCIAACSGNQVIYSMIQTISSLLRQISGSGMADEEQLTQIYEEHQTICGCILAKDAIGAGRAMQQHLDNSKKRYNYR